MELLTQRDRITANRTPLVLPAQQMAPWHSARPMPQAQDGFPAEPGQHDRVVGHQAGPKQPHAVPERRGLPQSRRGSSLSTSRPAHASTQQEVDGHEPARPEVSPGTQAARPNALAPLRKSSMGPAATRARVRRFRIELMRQVDAFGGTLNDSSLEEWKKQLLERGGSCRP